MSKHLLIALSLIFFISAAYSQNEYKNDEFGFTIKFPYGWEINKGKAAEVVVEAMLSESVNINIATFGKQKLDDSVLVQMGVEKFTTAMEDNFKKQYKSYKTLEYNETRIDGIFTAFISFNIKDDDSQLLIGNGYFFIKNGMLFGITAGCPAVDIETFRTVFKDCIYSMKFTK